MAGDRDHVRTTAREADAASAAPGIASSAVAAAGAHQVARELASPGILDRASGVAHSVTPERLARVFPAATVGAAHEVVEFLREHVVMLASIGGLAIAGTFITDGALGAVIAGVLTLVEGAGMIGIAESVYQLGRQWLVLAATANGNEKQLDEAAIVFEKMVVLALSSALVGRRLQGRATAPELEENVAPHVPPQHATPVAGTESAPAPTVESHAPAPERVPGPDDWEPLGSGKTAHARRYGDIVVKRMRRDQPSMRSTRLDNTKPKSVEERAGLARFIVTLMELARENVGDVVSETSLPRPDAGIVTQRFSNGLKFNELSKEAQVIADEQSLAAMRELHRALSPESVGSRFPGAARRYAWFVDDNPDNFRFADSGRLVSWFDPIKIMFND